jgi:hypothetical protein
MDLPVRGRRAKQKLMAWRTPAVAFSGRPDVGKPMAIGTLQRKHFSCRTMLSMAAIRAPDF